MALQVGLIFWLSAPETVIHRPRRVQGIFLHADQATVIQGLSDPTIFVLPNRHGFSGPAWVNDQTFEKPSLEWTEPPRWLALDAARLGSVFCAYVATNITTRFELAEPSEPEIIPVISDFRGALAPTQSTLRVEGELADRPLASPLALKSQPAQDMVLTSSEVALGVRDDGTVFSAKLVKSCGDRGVDEEALRLARGVRFRRLSGGAGHRSPDSLSWGTLVFQWHTIPGPTNSVVTRQ